MVHPMDSLKLLTKSVTTNTIGFSNGKIDEIIPRFTMMYALKKGYLNLIRHILCTGVNPNQIDSKDKYYRTPLIYCAYIKDSNWALSISQNLLECGGRLDQCDRRGLNVLHYCCAFNKYKLLELFLNSLDFDLLNKVDINGNTCLHYATAFRNLKCIRLILTKCKHYNLTSIEHENAFGYKPSDMLGLNHLNYSQEIDEKCKLILLNYDKNLLPNRQSFNNLANSIPLATRTPSAKNQSRSTTAPLTIDDNDDEKKQTICFTVIENLAKQNSINEKKRSFSTQSQTIFKLHNQNENNKENLGTNISNSNSSFGIRAKIKHHQVSKTSFDMYDNSNQLLIDIKDYISKMIIFSELCMDKEYIVNPKGINSVIVANNYHLNQPVQKLTNASKSTFKNVNVEMPLQRLSSSKTQKSFQLSIDDTKKIETNNYIISKPPVNNAKTLRSPSMTVISGRQSRQSFFTGCLVSSQSDVLDQMNFDSEDVFSAYQTPRVLKDETQKQIEKSYEALSGWKKYYMSNILNNLELKSSPSFRKTINVPVNTVAPLPIDINSYEFTDSKSKLNFKNKKASKNPHSRLTSATTSPATIQQTLNTSVKKK